MNNIIFSRTETGIIVRTILEAVLSWLVANLPEIFNLWTMSSEVKSLLMGFVMVIITTILSFVRRAKDQEPSGIE